MWELRISVAKFRGELRCVRGGLYIDQIRDKIGDKTNADAFITTEPGIGYRMEVLPTATKAA